MFSTLLVLFYSGKTKPEFLFTESQQRPIGLTKFLKKNLQKEKNKMNSTCAKSLYNLEDSTPIDDIALAMEETMKELSEQYSFPRGIARNKFKRHLAKINEANE